MANHNIATYTPPRIYNTDALIHSNERDQHLIQIVWVPHLLDIPLFSQFLSILELFSLSKS